MENKKLGQESEYPIMFDNPQCHGISKRFYAACMAMQGIIQSESFMRNQRESGVSKSDYIAHFSYQIADELLKQENL